MRQSCRRLTSLRVFHVTCQWRHTAANDVNTLLSESRSDNRIRVVTSYVVFVLSDNGDGSTVATSAIWARRNKMAAFTNSRGTSQVNWNEKKQHIHSSYRNIQNALLKNTIAYNKLFSNVTTSIEVITSRRQITKILYQSRLFHFCHTASILCFNYCHISQLLERSDLLL